MDSPLFSLLVRLQPYVILDSDFTFYPLNDEGMKFIVVNLVRDANQGKIKGWDFVKQITDLGVLGDPAIGIGPLIAFLVNDGGNEMINQVKQLMTIVERGSTFDKLSTF